MVIGQWAFVFEIYVKFSFSDPKINIFRQMVIQYFGASSERVDVLCICNICLPCLCSTMYPVYNLHTPLLNCSKIMSMEKRKSHFLGGRYSYPSIAFDSKLMTSSFYIIAIRYDICMVNTIIYAECMLNCIIKHSLSFSLSISLQY